MRKEMYDTIDSRVLRCFEVVKKVGQGAYGQVWKARNKKTGSICALKKIYEAFRNPADAQKAYREIKYLQRLDHPNIVRLLSYQRPANCQDIYLEFQFLEADLCVALKNSVLKEIHKHYIFYQMVNAVNFLHAAELLHRDIKPSNILVNQTCEAKLCDMGLIRSLKRDTPAELIVMTENVATRWYRAPEILLCTNNYGKSVDIWSLGCVLAEMFLQRPMFQGSSTISQLEKIFEFTGKPAREDLHFVKNEESLRIIDSMDCKERRSLRDLLPNEDKNMVDLLEKIFQVNPNKRPTADEIMKHPFLTRFRGRVCEKLPEKAIKIQYDRKLLTIDDYKSLLYGDLEEKDIVVDVRAKGTEEAAGIESNIYKTVPNHVGRNNFIHNYPWGKLENKSPMHTSNLNQKSLSPLARVKKDGFASPMPLLTVPEVDAKIQRHSPSFLNLKKKESPTKVTPEKYISHPTIPHPVAASHLKKKLSFPMRNSPKNNSPDRKYSPFRAKVEKENSNDLSTKIKETNDLSIKIKEKSNPESPNDFVKRDFESISSFKQFIPSALSPQHSQGLIKTMSTINVEATGTEPKIIKERMVVPKFIAEADKKAKDKNLLSFTPNKSKEKIRVSPFRERFQTRELSPIGGCHPFQIFSLPSTPQAQSSQPVFKAFPAPTTPKPLQFSPAFLQARK